MSILLMVSWNISGKTFLVDLPDPDPCGLDALVGEKKGFLVGLTI